MHRIWSEFEFVRIMENQCIVDSKHRFNTGISDMVPIILLAPTLLVQAAET